MRPLLSVSFVALLGLATWRESGREAVELNLVYLANEGFLLGSGETKVFIDAFVTDPYAGYAAVPPQLFDAMLSGAKPFEGVALALASHHHRDHFQAEAAAEFLRARADTAFLSSPQVVEDLLEELGEDPRAETIQAFLPESEETIRTSEGSIQVELLRIPHAGGPARGGIQNLGHLIEIDGARFLHVGDADLGAEELVHLELPKRDIDVALVPYWWLADAAGLEMTKKRIGAAHLVAVHVPTDEIGQVGALLATLDPSILLFREAGEAKTIAIER